MGLKGVLYHESCEGDSIMFRHIGSCEGSCFQLQMYGMRLTVVARSPTISHLH